MVRKTGARSVERSLRLLGAILSDNAESSLVKIAQNLNLPVSTAYRLVSEIEDARMLLSIGRGRYVAGPTLIDMSKRISFNAALIALGRPMIKILAAETGCVLHLGVLEDDMVTYLVREGKGPQTRLIFSEEGKQLEAYCSGIGKLLLAGQPEAQLDRYLETGPFVALTPKTIVDPKMIMQEIENIREKGYARDDAELSPNLQCLAVGINAPDGTVIAGLSISRLLDDGEAYDYKSYLPALRDTARQISSQIFLQ